VIADIQDEKGMNAATELGYENARFVHCNVTKESDVAAAMKFTVSTFGKLDICFSNAGYIGENPTLSLSLSLNLFLPPLVFTWLHLVDKCLVTTEMPLVQKPSSFKILSSQTSEPGVNSETISDLCTWE
jgi:NAD(P)-dependent dehydrogenase (short-subunit alcohol dehydrogenase family)